VEEIPEDYQFENVEQLRAVADPLRLRIADRLAQQPSTATQIGEALGIPANKIHYHVRELERVGLVKLVETREKGGILEKYYRLVARELRVPRALLRATPPDEGMALAGDLLQAISQNFLRGFAQIQREQDWEPGAFELSTAELMLTNEELHRLVEGFRGLLAPYEQRPAPAGATPRTLVLLAHPSVESARPTAEPSVEEESAPARAAGGRLKLRAQLEFAEEKPRRQIYCIGAVVLSRKELEKYAVRGQRLDINVLGLLSFTDDTGPELVDSVVASVRHRGKLIATPAVRAVLKRKGAERTA
jgi:DNA-binding transcriptional ArsR family regulator